MELRRIDNLWKFLGIKNNMTVNNFIRNGINYRLVKDGLEIFHHFNPKVLQKSSLQIQEINFQEDMNSQHYNAQKHRFGTKFKSVSPASILIFFPKDLLALKSKFDLNIQKDRSGHFRVEISPFSPKTVYDILNAVNLTTNCLWKKNFFSEGIRN